jgi:hypothetical protein
MFKKVLTALLTGVASGVAVGLGGWLWKNCAEQKANELKQAYDSPKNNSQKQGN